MAADGTSFDKAMREAYQGMLDDWFGKPYPGPGRVIELTAEQERENEAWRDRRDRALAWASEQHDAMLREAKDRFGVEVYEDIIEGGGFEVSDSEPHSPHFVPDDQAAYDQWRRDHPSEMARAFALWDRFADKGKTSGEKFVIPTKEGE